MEKRTDFEKYSALVLTGAEMEGLFQAIEEGQNCPLEGLEDGGARIHFFTGRHAKTPLAVRPQPAVFLAAEAGGDGHWGSFLLEGTEGVFLRFEDALKGILERRKDYAIRTVYLTVRKNGEVVWDELPHHLLHSSGWQPDWVEISLYWSYEDQPAMTSDVIRLVEIH